MALRGASIFEHMGFLDKFTKLSPEAQRLVDLKRQQLEKQAEGIREQIRASRDAQITRMQAEHRARIAPIEASIEASKRDSIHNLHKAMLTSMSMILSMNLSSALMRSIPREETERRNAKHTIRDRVQEKVDALKTDFTEENLAELEKWALARVENDKQGIEVVKKAFADFAQKLQEGGIAFESPAE